MEYPEDTLLCQILIRCGLVDLAILRECAEVQREQRLTGVRPRPLRDLLVRRGAISSASLDRLIDHDARRRRRKSERRRIVEETPKSGEEAAPGDVTPHTRKERDGVAPGQIIGPYQVHDRIAEGGTGTVFLAHDRSSGRLVALKVLAGLRAQRDPDAIRFQREARVACAVRHQGIVAGCGFGLDGDLRYYAMEFVRGESLRERIRRLGALPEDEVLSIGRRVADALAYLHERGILHRDVKPDNIILGERGEVKVCDLGLARGPGLGATVTAVGQALGTPRYISPEQARGDADVDTRSDVYSLGITLFHALTGAPPFPEESGIVVMSRHLYDSVPGVREARADLSRAIEELILRMTRKEREERPRHCGEVARELRRLEERQARNRAAS